MNAAVGTPNGLKADEVAGLAVQTSLVVRQRAEDVNAAGAAVGQAIIGYFPRVLGSARYTRLSEVAPQSLGTLVVAPLAPEGPLMPGTVLVNALATIASLQNQTVIQATLVLPVSDYLFKIPQTHFAATAAREAASFQQAATRLGVAGALVALVVTGAPFGFMAFLGIVSLIGVIVSHVIVKFEFIEEQQQKGVPLQQALIEAGTSRLRPVLITVAATVLGLVPLALHGGPLWEPLCYAQMGGLLVATGLTLFLVPVLYTVAVEDLKWVKWAASESDVTSIDSRRQVRQPAGAAHAEAPQQKPVTVLRILPSKRPSVVEPDETRVDAPTTEDDASTQLKPDPRKGRDDDDEVAVHDPPSLPRRK